MHQTPSESIYKWKVHCAMDGSNVIKDKPYIALHRSGFKNLISRLMKCKKKY